MPEAINTAVRNALLRVARKVSGHVIQWGGWTDNDECLHDLREAEREILEVVAADAKRAEAAEKERDRLKQAIADSGYGILTAAGGKMSICEGKELAEVNTRAENRLIEENTKLLEDAGRLEMEVMGLRQERDRLRAALLESEACVENVKQTNLQLAKAIQETDKELLESQAGAAVMRECLRKAGDIIERLTVKGGTPKFLVDALSADAGKAAAYALKRCKILANSGFSPLYMDEAAEALAKVPGLEGER